MAFIYKSYCYPSLYDIGSIITSEAPVQTSSGYYWYSPIFSINTSDSIAFSQLYKTSSTTASQVSAGTHIRQFPYCIDSDIGPIVNATGLTTSDAIELSWLVIAVFVAAWSIKQMKKSLF